MAHFETTQPIPDVRNHRTKNPLEKLIEEAKKMLFLESREETE